MQRKLAIAAALFRGMQLSIMAGGKLVVAIPDTARKDEVGA